MAVIPCNVDIATADIIERASKVDPGGERTIGVLTKPDLVDRGAESEVRDVLENRTKPLLHGFYMLKNKSQEQLNGKTLTQQESRDAELSYFSTSKYSDSDRLGVEVLRSALTHLLVSQIEKALPTMLEEVNSVLTKTETELASLGDAQPDSEHQRRAAAMISIRVVVGKLRRITEFADAGKSDFGGPKARLLRLELNARKTFAGEMLETRPDFEHRGISHGAWSMNEQVTIREHYLVSGTCKVIEQGMVGRVVKVPSIIVTDTSNITCEMSRVYLLSDDKMIGTVERYKSEPSFLATKPRKLQKSDIVKVRWDDNSVSDWIYATDLCSGVLIDFGGDVGRVGFPEEFSVIGKMTGFREDLANHMEEARGRELPGFMNFNVFSTLMGEYVHRWKHPTSNFQYTMDQALNDACESVVNFHVSKVSGLSEMIKIELKDHIKICKIEAVEKLHTLMEQEKIPCTENHYLYDTINKIRNQRMEDKIESIALNSRPGMSDYLNKIEVIKMLQSNIGNKSNESQEVQDMIDILTAYWKLAMKRYIDHVAMIITDTYTAPKRVEAIEQRLTDAVVKADEATLANWFQQCPRVSRRRHELQDTRTKMLKAQGLITDYLKGNMKS